MADDDALDRPPETAAGLPTAFGQAMAADVEEPEAEVDLFGGAVRRRGRGRPAGSKSRSTREWSEWLGQRFQSPLVTLSALYTANPRELARRWKCDPLDVVKLQVAAMREVAPYLHQKQPQAVQVTGDRPPALVMVASPEIAALVEAASGGAPLSLPPMELIEGDWESEENQTVSAASADKSTDPQSTDRPQDTENVGENGDG